MRLRAAALSRRAYEAATAGRWLCPCGRGRRSRFSSFELCRFIELLMLLNCLRGVARVAGGRGPGRVYRDNYSREPVSLASQPSTVTHSRYTHAFLRVGA